MTHTFTGFVLAGGKSRRMGTDKARLDWNGQPLIDHMVTTVGAVTGMVHVVGRDPLPDRQPGRGPVEGIATALAASTTENNLIVGVDLPRLETKFLHWLARRLIESSNGCVVCVVDERVPLCLGIHRGHGPAIDRYLEDGGRTLRGMLDLIGYDLVGAQTLHDAGFSDAMFVNINTPGDYQRSRPRH